MPVPATASIAVAGIARHKSDTMTYLSILNNASTPNGLAQPIQRTLIVMLGNMAAELDGYLATAFGDPDALSSAIARLPVGPTTSDPEAAIREKLAGISRAGAQAGLAGSGYVIDRLRELLLFLVVDLSDPAAAARAAETVRAVSTIAQTGWGLDTRVVTVALAEDWSEKAAVEALRSLANALHELATAIIPLNEVNESGLQLDNREAFMVKIAAIIKALGATPLRDALQWSDNLPEMGLDEVTLTTVGLSCWRWDPDPVGEYLAHRWRAEIIGRWLGTAGPEQALPAAQRAESWFAAHSLLPAALAAMIERSVEPVSVPSWPVPYPWGAAHAIHQMRALSAALADGRAGAVELVSAEWAEWPAEQEQALRGEMAEQLDREPVAGLDLAVHFLRGLLAVVDRAGSVIDHRQDQLEEHANGLLAQRDDLLSLIEPLLAKWPSGSVVAWAGLLLRPWRWPGLAWEYRTLHNRAKELERVVTRQAAVEREQVVVATVAGLYRQYEAVVRRTIDHIEEGMDMLEAARGGDRAQPEAPPGADQLIAGENPELAATEAAAMLGGLGRLATALDEELVGRLGELSRARFRFLAEWPAVGALERMMGSAKAADWWAAQWAEATPLWLFDDAGQPEDARGADRAWAAVCAAEVERLQALLGLPDRPDCRRLPAADKRHIYLLRWRTGVAL